jgi:hypothetical protein
MIPPVFIIWRTAAKDTKKVVKERCGSSTTFELAMLSVEQVLLVIPIIIYAINKNLMSMILGKASSSRKTIRLVFLHLCKALAAINRATVRGLEGNLCLTATSRANSGILLTLLSRRILSCVTALFAALGLVFKALAGIEFLFACGENKFFAAIFASESLVFVHDKIPRFEK